MSPAGDAGEHPQDMHCINPTLGLLFDMPTVVHEDGFRVRIYGPPREHPPAHVHIEKGQTGLVVIRLGTPERPPKVWRVYDMKDRDVLKAYRIVEKHHERIRQAWRAIHG